MAGDTSRRRELAKEAVYPLFILRDLGIDLAIRPLQIDIGQERWTAVARSRQIDRLDLVILDQPVEVQINETQTGRRAPVTQQAGLDVGWLQRPFGPRISLTMEF